MKACNPRLMQVCITKSFVKINEEREVEVTWEVDCLEAPGVVWSQFINGGDAGSRQDVLQEVCGSEAPHQCGELALGRGRADIAVHRADHRGICGARASRAAVDIVELDTHTGNALKTHVSNILPSHGYKYNCLLMQICIYRLYM